MSEHLSNRLNQILPRITDKVFLSSEGIGKEIACYIFDYPASDELMVREHLAMMMDRIASHHSDLRVLHLNLLDVGMAYLKHRRLFDKTIEKQTSEDDANIIKKLKGPFAAERVRDFIGATHNPSDYDLLILSGIGSIWPILRAHSLLNCLHSIMKQTPLVMFYPGTFDGLTLSLFGQIAASTSQPGKKPYYRAISLIAGGTIE